MHHINCIALHGNDLGYDFIPIDSIELDWTLVFSFLPSKMSYYKNVFLAFTMINLEEEVWVTFKLVIGKVNGSFLRSIQFHVWTYVSQFPSIKSWKNVASALFNWIMSLWMYSICFHYYCNFIDFPSISFSLYVSKLKHNKGWW